MGNAFRECLWKNFGAAIDMLKEAIRLCPEALWQQEKRFYYLSYHTLIFLDFYLSNPVKSFTPLLGYTIADSDKLPAEAVDDVLPDQFYSQQELLAYLAAIRDKCKQQVLLATDEQLLQRWITDNEIELHDLCPAIVKNYTRLEIWFYNLRHVQHHTAQLNVILRQKANLSADWVAQVND